MNILNVDNYMSELQKRGLLFPIPLRCEGIWSGSNHADAYLAQRNYLWVDSTIGNVAIRRLFYTEIIRAFILFFSDGTYESENET